MLKMVDGVSVALPGIYPELPRRPCVGARSNVMGHLVRELQASGSAARRVGC